MSSRIILMTVITILPFMVVIMLSSLNSRRALILNYDSMMLDDTRKRAQILSMEFDAFNDMLFQLVSDDSISNQLQVINSTDDPIMRGYHCNELYSMIKRYKYARGGLAQTVIIPSRGNFVSYDTSQLQTAFSDTYHSLFWDAYEDLQNSTLYEYFTGFYQTAGVTGPVLLEGIPANQYVFLMGEKFCNLSTLETEGVAVFSVFEDHMDEMCSMHGNDALASSFLISRDGVILTNENDSLIGQPVAAFPGEGTEIAEFVAERNQNEIVSTELKRGKSRNFLTLAPVHNTDYLMVSLFNYQGLDRMLDGLNRTLILSLLLMTAVVLLILWKFTTNITQDVSTLAEQILNGRWEDGIAENMQFKGNELEIIVSSYHLLLQKFQAATTSIRESSEREKQLELRALESQINSHFLYNTLDSINWMAIEQGNNDISEMIERLATILRYSINSEIRIVPFLQELNWVEGHLYIQRQRFNGNFTYEMSIDPEAMNFPVHKLILQPFIENAVLHGVREIDRPGHILLKCMVEENGSQLIVCIEDNGRGMTPVETELFFRNSEQALIEGHVGIANVMERLMHYYGNAFSLDVRSEPNKGTRITLRIPRIQVENKDEDNCH